MALVRNLLLAASRNTWLRDRAPRYAFVRRAVRRFMPGEEAEDALAATRILRTAGIGTILTTLGENLDSLDEAYEVARHYRHLLERIREEALDAQISVKLTQLGLDQDAAVCMGLVRELAGAARDRSNLLWIDMEGSAYTDATLDLFRRVRATHDNVGVCLQSYLRRTAADLESLLPLGPAIRIVKGAYREPPDIAFPRKADVDASFLALARRLLDGEARRAGAFAAIATHDPRLIAEIGRFADAEHVPRDAFEFEMLYGIQRQAQVRLAGRGCRVRVLISYGPHWFPWFMRRLAERPANMLFMARHLFAK